MASFEEILRRPASEIQPPKPIPPGTYHVMIDGAPAHEESSKQKIPCRVYRYKILRALEDVDSRAAAEQQVVGKTIFGQGPGTAFYITEDSADRYKQFLQDTLGIDNPGEKRSLEDLEAEVNGKQLLIKVKHDFSQDGKRVFAKIESTMRV